MINFALIIIGVLLIVLVVTINLLVILVHSQQNIVSSGHKLRDSIRSYTDIIPLMLFLAKKESPEIYGVREQFYSHWNDPEKSFITLKEIEKRMSTILHESSDYKYIMTMNRLREAKERINSSLHEYNALVLGLHHRLENGAFSLAKKLDFIFGKRTFKVIESS